jgi:hypothetical protein
MIDIVKKLKKLPQAKLSKKADLLLRFKFWQLSWQNKFLNYQSAFLLRKLIPATVVLSLLVMIIALPYYAYANDQIVRGDALYPVKQIVERVELSLAPTPAKKAEVYSKLAERRLSEIEILSSQQATTSENNLATTIDEMNALTAQASAQVADSLPVASQQQAETKITKLKEKQFTKIKEVANHWGLNSNDKLLDSLAITLDDLKPQKNQAADIKIPSIQISTSSKEYYLHFNQARKFPTTTITNATTTASSTIGAKPERARTENNQGLIAESLIGAKEKMKILRGSLSTEAIATSEMQNLFFKLNDRLDKAQSAINAGDLNQAQGLIKSTEALGNNAKHFLKSFDQASSTRAQLLEKERGKDREGSRNRKK